jgi:hypothetical protein
VDAPGRPISHKQLPLPEQLSPSSSEDGVRPDIWACCNDASHKVLAIKNDMGGMLREKLVEGAWHGEWGCMKAFELQVHGHSMCDDDVLDVCDDGAW